MARFKIIALLTFIFLALAAPAAEARPSVYFLVFDEFSLNNLLSNEGTINRERFPNFAALADESSWYRNHVAAADTTPAAVSALLTGMQPIGSNRIGSPQKSLFRLLAPSHQVEAMDNVVRYCRKPFCRASGGSDIDNQLGNLVISHDPPGKLKTSKTSTVFQAQQLAWMINSIKPSPRPKLWFAHAALPHVPWTYLENGDQYFHMGLRYPGTDGKGVWGANPLMTDLAQQRTIKQIRFVDLLLGQFVAKLKSEGLWQESMIIVTADHGASNEPRHHRRFIYPDNFSDIAGIPLFVKYPGQRSGRVSSRATKAVDLLPTIAEVVGAEGSFQGKPLDRTPRRRPLLVRNARLHTLIKMSLASFERQRKQRLAALNSRLPNPSPLASAALSRVKPQEISEVKAQGMRISLDRPWQYRSVVAGSGWRPAVFSTGYTQGIEAGRSLLITVNGRPAGIAATFGHDGKMRFAAMLDGLSERNNQVAVYVRAGYKWLRLSD